MGNEINLILTLGSAISAVVVVFALVKALRTKDMIREDRYLRLGVKALIVNTVLDIIYMANRYLG